MDAPAIQARLADKVPALRVIEDALSLAALVKSGAMPHQAPAAFVVPGGMTGRESEASAGAFVQNFTEVASVVLIVLTYTAAGQGRTTALHTLIDEVTRAICGWGPEWAPGVYTLASSKLLSLEAGAVTDQIDFALMNQLRIAP